VPFDPGKAGEGDSADDIIVRIKATRQGSGRTSRRRQIGWL
jgi:hypothetical protein